MTDDELEARLRDTLAARDPGTSAPATLRHRVSLVPTARTRTLSPIAGRSARAAGTILAVAAAVIIGLVGVTAVRLGSSGLAGPGGAPLPTVIDGGALPPPVTAAMPLALESWMAAGILGGLVVIVWFVLEGLAAPTATGSGEPVAPWTWPRGLGWLGRAGMRRSVLLVALVAAVGGPYNVGAVAHLGSGSYSGDSMINLLGGRTAYGSAQKSALFYSLAPGSTVSAGFSVRNDGSVPLTVLGLSMTDDYEELHRFAQEATTDEQFGRGGMSVDDSPTVAFTPFEVQPGGERFLLFVIKAPVSGYGPACTPAATPSPGQSLDMENYAPSTGGTASIDAVSLRFSALGVVQTADVQLYQTIVIVCPA